MRMMLHRLKNRVQFQVEGLLMRGPLHRLLVIALMIALVSLVAGTAVWLLTDQFREVEGSIWWAFLRLTDPGYLGDDQGTVLRMISTVVTVLGYVLFMGSLIAIMTQWLNATIARLEKGLTPIARRNHIIVLGWGLRAAAVVRDLMLSEGRVRRFLDRRGGGDLHVVILSEEVGHSMVQELKDRLGPLFSPRRITLRSGSPLRLEHLRRVDFLNAAAILLPGRETVDEDEASHDAVALKTLLSTAAASRQLDAEQMPLMVAELSDARAASVATRAYGGPIEVVASERLVARLIAQTVRHPNLSKIYTEVLSQEGSELYLRELPELVNTPVSAAREAFDRAVLIGVLRSEGGRLVSQLAPPAQLEIGRGDRLVLLAAEYAHSQPRAGFTPKAGGAEPDERLSRQQRTQLRRVMIFGWNQTAPELIRELGQYRRERYQVDVLSLVPTESRQVALDRRGVATDQVELRLLEGDAASPTDLMCHDLSGYDNLVVLASDRFESEVASDARTAMISLMLENALAAAPERPQVLIELNDLENTTLFPPESAAEVLVSPMLLGHVLSQVALRRELWTVYDELFGSGGAEITFRPRERFGLRAGEITFAEVQRAVWERGGVALGLVLGGEVRLNPNQIEPLDLGRGDAIVVLDDS